MLSFDSSLSNALANRNTTSFWVLKLYYADEGSSDFFGVSDTHRVDGSDIYYGLVSSWGNLQQSLDFYGFTTSASSMTINLINAERSIKGGRFSDLLSSYNFANRKWELFQNTSQAGTYDTAARMIGSGIIAGDIKYNTESISLTLLDNSSRFHKIVPYHTVDTTAYPNAPISNRNAPVPMAYGDFGEDIAQGTYGDFAYHFVKGKFPAIVVDKQNTDGLTVALPDTIRPHEEYGTGNDLDDMAQLSILYGGRVYMPLASQYLQCNLNNVKVGDHASFGYDNAPDEDGDNIIYFKGASYFAYFPLESLSVETGTTGGSIANWIDGDFSTSSGLGGTDGATHVIDFRFPDITKLGHLDSDGDVDLLMYISAVSGTGTNTALKLVDTKPGSEQTLTWGTGAQRIAMSSAFSATQRDTQDFSSEVVGLSVTADGGTQYVNINQVGLQIEVEVFKKYGMPVYEQETIYTGAANDPGGYKIVNTEVVSSITAKTRQYMYYAGKGREYGGWIDADSRNNGYNDTNLIENPIFLIEHILRSELGLTSSEIDHATFDTSGNTTNGHIVNTFDEDAVGDIKFAFSQYKFLDSKELIKRLSKQCCSYVFIGGDGKFKIKTLQKAADYGSANKTIDYLDINLKGISKTPLSQIKNDVTVNYDFDYMDEVFKKSKNRTATVTANSTGNNQVFKLKLDASAIIDDTTADNLAIAYKDIFKDQKIALDFQCINPKYNDLEIGDIIKFKNWDSKIKIYGAAMGTDYYIVQSISKTPSTSSIKAIKVS